MHLEVHISGNSISYLTAADMAKAGIRPAKTRNRFINHLFCSLMLLTLDGIAISLVTQFTMTDPLSAKTLLRWVKKGIATQQWGHSSLKTCLLAFIKAYHLFILIQTLSIFIRKEILCWSNKTKNATSYFFYAIAHC